MDSHTLNQLNDILVDLKRIDGVESSLITDNNGNVLCHNMSKDTTLFGPMAHVITSSSKRLLSSVNQGEIEQVLIESEKGKALFLHLGNVHFILLMEVSANVGYVMISAKRAALKITELTKDIIFEEPVEEEAVAPEVSAEKSEIDKIIEANELEPGEIKEVVEEIAETEGVAKAFDKVVGPQKLDEIMESSEFETLDMDEAKEKLTEILETEKEDISSTESRIDAETKEITHPYEEKKLKSEIESVKKYIKEPETPEEVEDIKKFEPNIPVINPPIPFPTLPDIVQIPENPEKRANLVLDVYESIFLAISIGTSKTLGVSPARGLIKRFLPLEDCKTLLEGVEVKSNSTIDFDKIRENTEEVPVNEREQTLITDFSKIIDIITENYGKLMGYSAFRGVIRAEFKVINNSYGKTIDELGIKEKLHPELMELFN